MPGSAGTYVSTGKETGQLGSAVTYDEGQTWQNLENTTQLEVGAASADGRVWGGPSFGYYNSPMVFRLG